uniref:Uncharacterized protein n=1 Tax=Romanomermis culicivorax TaxID=13658 RepID=A0A915IEW8_ROMCU
MFEIIDTTIRAVSADYFVTMKKLFSNSTYLNQSLKERYFIKLVRLVHETADIIWLEEAKLFLTDTIPLYSLQDPQLHFNCLSAEHRRRFLSHVCSESLFNTSQFKRIMDFLVKDEFTSGER